MRVISQDNLCDIGYDSAIFCVAETAINWAIVCYCPAFKKGHKIFASYARKEDCTGAMLLLRGAYTNFMNSNVDVTHSSSACYIRDDLYFHFPEEHSEVKTK